jgi:hypothetical protein
MRRSRSDLNRRRYDPKPVIQEPPCDEIRAIVDEITRPAERLKTGTALVDAFRAAESVDLDLIRDKSLPEAATFERANGSE